MRISEYLNRAFEAYNEGRINEEAYNSIVMNADIFCDEDDEDEEDKLPFAYTEIEYSDFDNAIAIEGAKFDDMNYLHYMER